MPEDLLSLERAARDSLAQAYGHPLSDEEWSQAKYALVEVVTLLREWTRPAKQTAA